MSQPDKDKERRRSKRLAKRRRTARKEPVVLRLFNWTITYEPLPESVSGIKQPSGVIGLDEAQRLNRLMHTDPGEVIQPLRELLARHPDVPAFCTWLAGAYALTGHPAEADAITRLNYERNPTYLFARIVVLDLTERTHGNASGMGAADFITRKLADKINFPMTYANGLTAALPNVVRMPVVLDDDREAIRTAVKVCYARDLAQARVARIKDTLHMSEIFISESMLPEARANSAIEILSPPAELMFDPSGNLI